MKKISTPALFKIEKTLGSLEYEVMEVVWDRDKTTVREILLHFQDKGKRKLAYTTIMTVMNNLYKKGFLTRQKIKKAYYYSPITKENYVVTISLSSILKDLAENYGKRRVLYSALVTSILPKINIAIITPASNKVIKTYRTPVGYGVSLTLLLFLFGLSAYDLLQNFSFFGTSDYLRLLTSGFTNSSDHIRLVVLALFESLPILNFATTAISFFLVVILARKLSKILNFRIPTFTNLGSVI